MFVKISKAQNSSCSLQSVLSLFFFLYPVPPAKADYEVLRLDIFKTSNSVILLNHVAVKMENRGHDVFLRHQVTDWGPAGCGGHRAVVGCGAAQVPKGGGALVNPPGGAGLARCPPQRLLAAPQQEGRGSPRCPVRIALGCWRLFPRTA